MGTQMPQQPLCFAPRALGPGRMQPPGRDSRITLAPPSQEDRNDPWSTEVTRGGPGRGRGREGILQGCVLVPPTHQPALAWRGGAGPRPQVGDINHGKHLSGWHLELKGNTRQKGGDFPAQAPGVPGPGGHTRRPGHLGSSPGSLGEGPPHGGTSGLRVGEGGAGSLERSWPRQVATVTGDKGTFCCHCFCRQAP